MTIVTFFVVLLALVLVHEFGHFWAAKISKMRVDEFAFGFPPKLFSKKYGETEYVFNSLPLGGYVKIKGEDPRETTSGANSFSEKPRHLQAFVVLAGVIFNLLFAWVILSLVFMLGARLSTSMVPKGAEIKDVSLVVTAVLNDFPAAEAGIKTGDVILSIDSGDLNFSGTNPSEASSFLAGLGEAPASIKIKKPDGALYEVTLAAKPNSEVGRNLIGVSLDEIGTVSLPFFQGLVEGGKLTIRYTALTGEAIVKFFKEAFLGKAEIENLTGPVGVAGLVGKAKNAGFVPLLILTAIISINLALFNLLPLPALDGGRLLFIGIESVIRRPISAHVYGVWNAIGFFLIIALVIIVTYHDIIKIL